MTNDWNPVSVREILADNNMTTHIYFARSVNPITNKSFTHDFLERLQDVKTTEGFVAELDGVVFQFDFECKDWGSAPIVDGKCVQCGHPATDDLKFCQQDENECGRYCLYWKVCCDIGIAPTPEQRAEQDRALAEFRQKREQMLEGMTEEQRQEYYLKSLLGED